MNRNLKLNLIGNAASTLASTLYNFCTGLFILDLTGSALLMSVYLAYAMLLGVIIQPFGGVFVERNKKVKIMYMTDTIFAATDIMFGCFLFVVNSPAAVLTGLYVNATINTFMNAMFEPASNAALPLMVKTDQLPKAYSLFSIVGNTVNIFGIISASVIYAMIPYKWILIINGCLIGISAFAERLIKIDEELKKDKKSNNYFSDLAEGIKYLFDKKILVQITASAIIANIFLSGVFSVAVPYMYNSKLQFPTFYLGMIQVVLSLGSIVSALVISKKELNKKGYCVFGGFTGYAVGLWSIFVIYTLMGNGYIKPLNFQIIFSCIAALIGVSTVIIQIPVNVIYATAVEPIYMGRIMALRKTFSTIAAPLAMTVFGGLVDSLSLESVFLTAAVGASVCLLIVSRMKKLLKS